MRPPVTKAPVKQTNHKKVAASKNDAAKGKVKSSNDAKTLKHWLREMLLIREFEVRTMQAYQNRLVGGFCHIYSGQEAVAVGTIAALQDDDPIITAYRCHGHALARGMDPYYCMAELFGRFDGCAKGKGGSMHMFDREKHLYGGHAIVGAQTPLATGLAFATKYEQEVIKTSDHTRVTVCYLGDGALNQGGFHEAMNLAGVLDLPVIFVIENNGYAMGTSVARGTTLADALYRKAESYGMTGHLIEEGMDVVTVHDQFKKVVDETRKTSKPDLVEIRTYRFKGHSMSDPRKYRTHEEEEKWNKQDPIDHLSHDLIKAGELTQDEFKKMTTEIRGEIRDVVKRASEAEPPPLDELYVDVHTGNWGPFKGTTLPNMLRGDNEKTTDQNQESH